MYLISGLYRFPFGQEVPYKFKDPQIDRPTHYQVKIGISSTGCSPHVDFDYQIKGISTSLVYVDFLITLSFNICKISHYTGIEGTVCAIVIWYSSNNALSWGWNCSVLLLVYNIWVKPYVLSLHTSRPHDIALFVCVRVGGVGHWTRDCVWKYYFVLGIFYRVLTSGPFLTFLSGRR